MSAVSTTALVALCVVRTLTPQTALGVLVACSSG
jgi:hypothetical protein